MDELPHERNNRRKGVVVSVVIHALLLFLFAFMLAWREPDPPLPEYGIEINFGLDQQGAGDIQPETPVTNEQSQEDPAPEPPAEQEESEVQEEVTPEETIEEVIEPVEEVAAEEVIPVENTQESPEVVQEQPKKPEPKKEEPKEEPVKKEAEKPKEEKVKSVYKPSETSGADGSGKSTPPSQGDDTDVKGDKGSEEGKLDARSLYGKPGGGQGGTNLNIVGWMWDSEPRKKDSSNENGTVTFEFMIDEEGYVIRVVTLQRSVSPSVAKFYEDQLKETTFSRTGTGVVKSGNTKGTVTFTIVSK